MVNFYMNVTSKASLNDKNHCLSELKEMLQESNTPKEKVFAIFCHRHGVSLEQCQSYYNELAAKDEIKEKQ
jgi:hypothetical protein